MERSKNIYFISESVPHHNYGSFIIFYRHLKLLALAGHNITIIVPKYDNIDNKSLVPSDWKILQFPSRLWFYPPYRRNFSFLRFIRYVLMYVGIREKIKQNNPDIIINYISGNLYAGFAVFLKKIFKTPLVSFLHDDPILMNLEITRTDYESYDKYLFKNADKIFSVSKELAFSIRGLNTNSVVLPPIPYSFESTKPKWKNTFNRPTIGFAGKISQPYVPLFELLLESLKNVEGRMILITDEEEVSSPLLEKFDNLSIHPPFEKNEEVLSFFNDNVSGIFVGYPNAVAEMPWLKTCFPSKFVEFCQTKLPIITISPNDTSFNRWCIENGLNGNVPQYRVSDFTNILNKLRNQIDWGILAEQTTFFAENILSPAEIQMSFNKEIENLTI